MEKYLCGAEALKYWQVPGVDRLLEKERIPSYLSLRHRNNREADNKILTCSSNKNIRKYLAGDICKIELVFAQLAKYLTDQEIIYLGLQICSQVGDFTPLSNVRTLRKCVRSLKGFCNQKRVLRLLQFVKDRSYSSMESFMYMFLGLPNRYGGAGFTEFEFNVRIEACKSIKRTMYGDICYVSKKLMCEYDSRTFHDNPSAYIDDNIRASILEENGWQVVSVRFAQLHDPKLFRILCSNVARRLGFRLRFRSAKYWKGYWEIMRIMEKATGIRR